MRMLIQHPNQHSMHKYDKIKRLGHRATDGIFDGTIVITEKLDGNNFRFTKDENGDIVFGSRNVDFKDDNFGHQFEDAASFVLDSVDPKDLREKYVYYGENMIKHTLDYDWNSVPQLLLFDIYDTERGKYINHQMMEEIAANLGLPTVPRIDVVEGGPFKESLDPEDFDAAVPDSKYREGKAEGIVISNLDNGVKAKIRTEEFKERHRSDMGGKDSMEHMPEDDTSALAAKYATDGRVNKILKKLTVDEDRDLEMGLMEELPMRVVDDIFAEEHEEMARSDKAIHFKRFRKRVAKKCLSILRSEIRKRGMKDEKE